MRDSENEIGLPKSQFSPNPTETDCSFVERVVLAEIDFPVPLIFESCHFRNNAKGRSSGSETPENVRPNSMLVVDCSSTEITTSTRFSSEPGITSGMTPEKYCRLYRFLKPFVSFAFEKTSPGSTGISRRITSSFVFVFPRTRICSI